MLNFPQRAGSQAVKGARFTVLSLLSSPVLQRRVIVALMVIFLVGGQIARAQEAPYTLPDDLVPITAANVGQLELLAEISASAAGGSIASDSTLAFNYDGTVLVSNWNTEFTHLWAVSSGELLFEITDVNRDAPFNLAISPTENLVAVWGMDGARLWDIDAQSEIRQFTDRYPSPLGFSQDGMLLALTSDEGLHLWDIQTQTDRVVFSTNRVSWKTTVGFTPDGRYVMFEASDGETDPSGILYVGDIATGELWEYPYPLFFTGHWKRFPAINTLDTSTNGILAASREYYLALRTAPGNVVQHPFEYLRLRFTGSRKEITDAAFSSGNSVIAVSVWVYDIHIEDENCVFRLGLDSEEDKLCAPTLNAYASVYFFDVISGEILATLGEETYQPVLLTFSPDGTLLATSDESGIIRLWGVRG